MNKVVEIFSRIFGKLLDLLMWPFNSLELIWSLVFVSALAGILLIILYRYVSNQSALRKVKQNIYAALLESILYRHSVKLCLKAQTRMFGGALKYFALALKPLFILAIPCLLLLAQLNLYFSNRTLNVGESALVSVDLQSSISTNDIQMMTNTGIKSEAIVRMPSLNKIEWRIRALEYGSHAIAINNRSDSTLVEKSIIVGPHFGPLVEQTFSKWWQQLLYPTREDGFRQDKYVEAISISYPDRNYKVFGFKMHWIVIFLITSILSGLLGARIFGVEI